MRAYEPSRLSNILLYGAPGVGKTHIAASIAKKYRTLLFDIDLGASTVGNLPKETQDNLVVLQYTEFKDLNTIYRLLLSNTPNQWNKFFKQNNIPIEIEKPFEAVIIDTLSELQRHMENELSTTNLEQKMQNLSNIKPLRIQDWGAVSDLTEAVVADAFGELPIVFIALAHEQMIENEDLGEYFGVPKLRGKLALDIGKHFDLMGRLAFARSGQRVLFTREEKKWQAKSRGKLDSIIVDPDLVKIIEGGE